MRNHDPSVVIMPPHRVSQCVAEDNEMCRRESRGWGSTTRTRIRRLGQIENRWLDCIS